MVAQPTQDFVHIARIENHGSAVNQVHTESKNYLKKKKRQTQTGQDHIWMRWIFDDKTYKCDEPKCLGMSPQHHRHHEVQTNQSGDDEEGALNSPKIDDVWFLDQQIFLREALLLACTCTSTVFGWGWRFLSLDPRSAVSSALGSLQWTWGSRGRRFRLSFSSTSYSLTYLCCWMRWLVRGMVARWRAGLFFFACDAVSATK